MDAADEDLNGQERDREGPQVSEPNGWFTRAKGQPAIVGQHLEVYYLSERLLSKGTAAPIQPTIKEQRIFGQDAISLRE